MAVAASLSITLVYSGDVTGTETISAAANSASPGAVTVQSLASGFNSITVPTSTGVTVKGVVIVPPSGNTTNITIKGVTGDTGIQLHDSDPAYISIDSTVTTIGLTAAAIIQGVRFFWF